MILDHDAGDAPFPMCLTHSGCFSFWVFGKIYIFSKNDFVKICFGRDLSRYQALGPLDGTVGISVQKAAKS